VVEKPAVLTEHPETPVKGKQWQHWAMRTFSEQFAGEIRAIRQVGQRAASGQVNSEHATVFIPLACAYFSFARAFLKANSSGRISPELIAVITGCALSFLENTFHLPQLNVLCASLLSDLIDINPVEMSGTKFVRASLSFVLAQDFDPFDPLYASVILSNLAYHQTLIAQVELPFMKVFEQVVAEIIGDGAQRWVRRYIECIRAQKGLRAANGKQESIHVILPIRRLYHELRMGRDRSVWLPGPF
jgi:hypothetical protein